MNKKINILITFFILFFVAVSSFGYSVILSPKFTAFDSSGDPLSGGLLYTYECGTTTGKTTYSSYSGTANTNPVVLNSRGEASVYTSGCVKLVLKDSDSTTLWTVDNVQSFDSTVLQDTDRDTKIQMEESADEDVIRFDINGTQKVYIDSNGIHTTNVSFTDGHGQVWRSNFSYKDADEIYIGAGAYEHNGTTQQFVYWNSTLTFELESAGSNSDSSDYGADGWHYIYLDDSAIVTQASPLLDNDCFLNSTTAPTYSATKHGWYNGNDRCIFAVYETGSDMLEWTHDGGNYVGWVNGSATLTVLDEDVDSTFEEVDCSAAIPGFSSRLNAIWQLEVKTADATVTWRYRPGDSSQSTGTLVGYETRAGSDIKATGTFDFFTNSSNIFDAKTSRNGDDEVYINVNGWYFPTGM